MPPSLRVHVVPVGDDKIERIWMPLKLEEADKIYLLTMKGDDKYEDRVAGAKKAILDQGLVRADRLVEEHENLYDYTGLMCLFARICRVEQVLSPNRVFFNVSTGGKLIAHAAMLACLIFDATPYYCKQKYPEQEVSYPPELLYFPHYPVNKPNVDVIQFLVNLRNYMASKKRDWVSKKECLDFPPVEESELVPSPDGEAESTKYKKIKYRFLDKLVGWHFATVDQRPRGKVRVTGEGQLAARVFAIYYDIRHVY